MISFNDVRMGKVKDVLIPQTHKCNFRLCCIEERQRTGGCATMVWNLEDGAFEPWFPFQEILFYLPRDISGKEKGDILIDAPQHQ